LPVVPVPATGRKGVSISDRATHEGDSVAVIDVPRMPIGMHPGRQTSKAQHISIFIDRSVTSDPVHRKGGCASLDDSPSTYCAQPGGDA